MPETKESKEFNDAFAEATGLAPTEKPEEKEVKKELDEEEVKTEDGVADKEGVDQPDNADELYVATEDVDAASEAEAKALEDIKDLGECAACTALQSELAAEKQRNASWDGRIRSANDRANLLQTELDELKARGTAEEPESGDASPDDKQSSDDELLAKFKTEFPDFVKPLEIMAQRVAGKEVKTIEPKVQALEEDGEERAQRLHLEQIETAHPDFRDLVTDGKIRVWIDSQPSFIKASLDTVFKTGNATEVIEMFDTYKRINVSTYNPKKEKLASKKAEDLLAVPASDGPIPEGVAKDKNDFDAGWKEANSAKK